MNADLYQKVSRFAAEAHAGQLVPGTELPYLLHIVQVSAEVLLALAAAPECDGGLALACALLHDTLEDTSVTYEQLSDRFGESVAAGVLALTKNTALPKAERMADSLQRILVQPPEVAMVKLADRITNLQKPPTHWSSEKIAAYKVEAQTILDALGHASPALAARLSVKLAQYPPAR